MTRVAVTGSTGLIGTALVESLVEAGHEVTRVLRRPPRDAVTPHVMWDPARDRIDASGLEGHDAVVHLAGESIAGLWTRRKRRAIRESRVRGTRLLAETLARLERPPRALLSASAVGIYGDRPGAESIDESAGPGEGFLPETGAAWEAATAPATEAGIRVATLRFGLVLAREGGLLRAMLPPFRLGLGARLGNGRQWMPWIALDDVVGSIRHILMENTLAGPVNVVAPEAVTNAEFTRALAHALHRPAFLRLPAFIARLVLRDQADEMLLGGARVTPRRLLETGYVFQHPRLAQALASIL